MGLSMAIREYVEMTEGNCKAVSFSGESLPAVLDRAAEFIRRLDGRHEDFRLDHQYNYEWFRHTVTIYY